MGSNDKNRSAVTRRTFLGTAGLALGVSTLTPLIPAIDSALRFEIKKLSGNTLKLGLLLPASNIYPAMAENFYSGLKLYLSKTDDQISQTRLILKPESLGFGPSSILEKSKKLIQDDGVDIVTGIISESVSGDLRNLFEDSGKFLVANHTGANILDPHEHSPNIVHNSLNLWQANYAMGKWAAKNIGQKSVVVSSFYESGYDALYAFNLGFESEGGEVLETCITNLPAEMKNTDRVISEIEKYSADLIFASFSGSEANEFITEFTSSDLSKKTPLLGSGFLVEENVFTNQGGFNTGIKTCLPWAPGLKNKTYQNFQLNFKKMTGRAADAFAVLGFESASLITKVVEETNGNLGNKGRVREILFSNQLSGPRGNLKLNKRTHLFESPLYLRELRKESGKMANVVISELNPVEDYRIGSENLKSGWLNPYLCA
jgi:branched-chain amino acid transport system substrate-binding protein